MLATAKVPYLFLYVNDLSLSRAFYEQQLGFHVIEEDSDAVKYDAGGIMLALNRAGAYGIQLTGQANDTSLIVFQVDDIDVMRANLETKQVVLEPTLRYEIGATASFYDPDGHCLTLYEVSTEAMQWPSGNKLRAILKSSSAASPGVVPTPAGTFLERQYSSQSSLGDCKMVYLFLFVRSLDEAADFYRGRLGLRVLEEDPAAGVMKYDGGGIIIATHLVAGDSRAKPDVDLAQSGTIAPVFHVSDLHSVYEQLLINHVHFLSRPTKSEIGLTAQFRDPNGHRFFLYQPSDAALFWPSGAKLRQILEEPF